jgi:hypothetical protein
VRKLITLTLASTAILAVACSKKSPVTAMSDDLKQDLKLASVTQDIRINPDEIAPASKPVVATKPKKAPSGPKVVRSKAPTVLASATPVEEAPVESDVPDIQAIAPAPAESEPTPDAPPLARPSVIPVSNAGNQGIGSGHADGGSGSGGGWGAVFGAVIRGGIVGDDDHCDPRTMPRNGRRPTATDIYSGGMRGMGGMGGMRGLPTGIAPRVRR